MAYNQNWNRNTMPQMDQGQNQNDEMTNFDPSVFQPAVVPRSMMTNPMNMSGSFVTAPMVMNDTSGRLDMPDFGTNTRILNDSGDQPESLRNPIYVPGYLRQMIGKWVRLEMLIGTNLVTRIGRLAEVGASFIVLQMADPRATMLCDMYSIKFVSIVNNANDFNQSYGF